MLSKQTVPISSDCSPLSCSSCADPQIRVTCAAVQSCVISRCVASPAEVNSVLCGVGGLVSSSYHQMAASWMAMFQVPAAGSMC